MRFWDASAVIPLLLFEARSVEMRDLLASDAAVVVWWVTRSECVSALARCKREGNLSSLEQAQARVRLHYLQESWTEMRPTLPTRTLAETFLDRHPLRTADAYQLAAAFRWAGQRPQGEELVSLDDRLRRAAGAEGFVVLPTP